MTRAGSPVALAIGFDAAREGLRPLAHLRAVHQQQRLRRDRRGRARALTDQRLRRVERDHRADQLAAFHREVNAPPLLRSSCVPAPNIVRSSTPRNGEHRVANGFAFEPLRSAAHEERVLGISGFLRSIRRAGLLRRRRWS